MRIFLSRWIYSLSLLPLRRSHYGAIFRECAITDAEEIHCSARLNRTSLYYTSVVYTPLNRSGERPAQRGLSLKGYSLVARARRDTQLLRSTDLIVLLYLSKTLPLSLSLSVKTKRFAVCKVVRMRVCVRVCVWTSEPVEWVYCSRRWHEHGARESVRRGDEVSRRKYTRDTGENCTHEQWRIHRREKLGW